MPPISADNAWDVFDRMDLADQKALLLEINTWRKGTHRELSDQEFRRYTDLIPILAKRIEERELGEALAAFLPGGKYAS